MQQTVLPVIHSPSSAPAQEASPFIMLASRWPGEGRLGYAGVDGDAIAFNSLGNVCRNLNRFQEAIESYDKAVALSSDIAEIHYNRGLTLVDLMRYEEAVASFDRALALNPGFASALNDRGNAFCWLGRLDEALASFDRALALNPDLAEAHNGRGVVLIGHSQGSGVLTRMIPAEVEGKPVQKQLISALILGSNLGVETGKDTGVFKTIPLSGADILLVLILSAVPLLLIEAWKVVLRQRGAVASAS